MIATILTVVAFSAAAVYLFGFCYRKYSPLKAVIKASAIAPLIIVALIWGGPLLLLLALALCLLGDVMLAFDDDRRFLTGVGAFALGHVAYIWLFLTHPMAQPALIVQMPQIAVVGLLCGVAALVAPLLFRGAGPLRFAVMGYVPMIVGLGVAALGFVNGMPIVTIGALLFVASDLVLGLEMFVLKTGTWAARLAPFWVWAIYWSAQALFVVGLT